MGPLRRSQNDKTADSYSAVKNNPTCSEPSAVCWPVKGMDGLTDVLPWCNNPKIDAREQYWSAAFSCAMYRCYLCCHEGKHSNIDFLRASRSTWGNLIEQIHQQIQIHNEMTKSRLVQTYVRCGEYSAGRMNVLEHPRLLSSSQK